MMIELWVKKRTTVVTHPTQTMSYVLCFQLVAQAARSNIHCAALRKLVCYRQPQAARSNLHCAALRKLVCYRQPQARNILWTKSEHKILHSFCKHIKNIFGDTGMLSKDLATELLYKPEPNSKILTIKHLSDCLSLSLSLSLHPLFSGSKQMSAKAVWALQFSHFWSCSFCS